MPSNRLAFLSVAVGSALLGWATAGVSAIGSDLPSAPAGTTTPAVTQQHDVGLHDHHHGHRGRPGV
jgi:transcription elongation factor